jgi:hypothetical protein
MHNPRQSETTLRSIISPVQLAKADQVVGTIFRKQLFSFGTWVNPLWWLDGEPTMELTVDMATKMVQNFNNNVLGSPVPVPLNHTDDVKANTGTVIKLEVGDDGLYGYLDIKRPAVVDDINNGLIYDVSIGFDWDYVSQKDNTHYGPTLFHVALVNTPYINNMSGFTETELAKRNYEYAQPLQVAGQPSVIMMSKAKVEELKGMKFAKVKNNQAFPVEVTHTNEAGEEVRETVEPGAEVEVLSEQADAVTKQFDEATAPEGGEGEGSGEGEGAGAGEGEGSQGAGEGEGEGSGTGTGEGEVEGQGAGQGEGGDTELARLRERNAELEAEKEYGTLLSSGHITPAQKDLFMAFAKAGSAAQVKLSTEIKTKDGKQVLFAKGATPSVTAMLSAILSAGPKVLKLGEQGGKGEEAKVELTKEQEEKLAKRGINVETFKKRVAEGKITLEDIDNE